MFFFILIARYKLTHQTAQSMMKKRSKSRPAATLRMVVMTTMAPDLAINPS